MKKGSDNPSLIRDKLYESLMFPFRLVLCQCFTCMCCGKKEQIPREDTLLVAGEVPYSGEWHCLIEVMN